MADAPQLSPKTTVWHRVITLDVDELAGGSKAQNPLSRVLKLTVVEAMCWASTTASTR